VIPSINQEPDMSSESTSYLSISFEVNKERLSFSDDGKIELDEHLNHAEQTLIRLVHCTEAYRLEFPASVAQAFPAPIPPFSYSYSEMASSRDGSFEVICGQEDVTSISHNDAKVLVDIAHRSMIDATEHTGTSFRLTQAVILSKRTVHEIDNCVLPPHIANFTKG
jgi:hypothetical protein